MKDSELDRLALLCAEKVREIATRQGNVPFLTGDLRKSIVVQPAGPAAASIGSNLPYARPVHDGRPAITIRPKNKKALYWKGAKHPVKKVHQKARKGKPFIKDAIVEMTKDLSFLEPHVSKAVLKELEKEFKNFRNIIG